MATITILGSGTSTGVPVIGCKCETCKSPDPRDRRLRASLLMTLASGERLVVDTGPDFREQMLREGVDRLEHVLYTHTHADHVHGFDDLRQFFFQQRRGVTCHVAAAHAADFKRVFAYAFEDTGYLGTKPQVTLAPFDETPLPLLGLTVEPAFAPHGNIQTAVFKFGRFVYATDFKAFPDELVRRWRGQVDVMVASGIHMSPHVTHSSIPETLALFEKLKVKQGVITHLAHEVLHAREAARLPPGVTLAYDGLRLTADVGA